MNFQHVGHRGIGDVVTNVGQYPLDLKQAKVECRIVIRVGAAAISWQVSARGMFEFCVTA